MSVSTPPLFDGDLYDAALRFARDADTPDLRADAPALASAWRQVGEMGWPAVLVPEAQGGAGGTLADLAAIAEGLGRHALPLPLIERCAAVPLLLSRLQGLAVEALRDRLVSGDASIAMAWPTEAFALALQSVGGEHRLSGVLQAVDLTVPASHVLVVAQDSLLVIHADPLPALGPRYRSVDGRTVSDMTLAGLTLPADALLVSGPEVTAAVREADDLGALMTTVQVVGAMGALLELTVDYLKTRRQFGVQLSTFQALRHHVVDLYVLCETARGLVERVILDAMAQGRLDPRQASLAKAYVAKVGRQAAESAIQLHGGMGMTEELLVARLAQRVLASEFDHGDRHHHLQRLLRDWPVVPFQASAAPA